MDQPLGCPPPFPLPATQPFSTAVFCCPPPPPHPLTLLPLPLLLLLLLLLPAVAEVEALEGEESQEAAEVVAALVGDADIDPAVAATNARLVEEFKAKMKVGQLVCGGPAGARPLLPPAAACTMVRHRCVTVVTCHCCRRMPPPAARRRR